MIKTKIIVKPKDGSSSSGSVTEGSYGSGYADYAASAGRSKQSDRSALATLAETAISAYRAKRADMASELDPDSETLQGYVLKEWLGKLLSVVDVDGTEQDINGTVGDGMKIMPHLGLTSIDVSGDGHISLGGMQMVYDAEHSAWRLDGSLYVTGGLSALGNSDVAGGGGGGLDAELLWSLLSNNGTEQISKSHLADALAGYATEDWVEGKGYLTNRDVYTKAEIDAKDWSSNKGTVTSVGITMPTGFSVSGSPITEKGILAVGFASGYSLPTTAKQSNWDTVYNWYSGITGSDTDTIINKWGEIISFLDGIEDTATLSGIVNGINQSITAEANRAKAEERSLSKSITDEVSRAKAAEQTLTSSISTNTSAINVLKGYFTNGVAKSAVKLQTARKIWGNTFDGTQDVAGDLILPNGKKIVIGGASLSWDADNKSVKIDGSVYATGGLSALGNSDVAGGGGGLMGSIVPYAKAIALTVQNEGSEIASAWSVKMLYDKIENVDVSGQLTSYLTKQEARTLYQPVGNYLTAHQSLDGYVNGIAVEGTGNAVTTVAKSGKTVIFTKGANYLTGITKAQVEGVLTGNITSHTHSQYLTSHQSLANYYNKTQIDNSLAGKSPTSHTHSVIINGSTKTITATGGTAVNLGTYLTSHQSLAAYLTSSAAESTYLKLSGGTLSGNLNLGSNTLFAGDISIDAEGKNWNFSKGNKIKLLSWSDSTEATGAPGPCKSGVSFMTHYVGFQLLSYGGDDESLLFRKMEENGVWHSWHNIYHEGHKPTKSDVGLGNVDNTADANKSVSYASTAGSANSVAWSNVSGRPTSMPASDVYAWAKASSKPGYSWGEISGKPSTFAPSSHTHNYVSTVKLGTVSYAVSSNVVSLPAYPTTLPASDVYAWAKASSKPGYSWSEISGKPSTFAPSSHTHKWAEITDRITKVSQLSNDSGYITSSASISGNAGSATRLQTARTIWGQSFNGTGNVSGALSGVTTIAASGQVSVGSLKIGSVTITYDSTNKGLKIDGGGLYSTSYVSALGESTASGSSGGSSVVAVPYVNAKSLTTEDTSKVASAYSVAQLSSLITSNTTSISSLQSSMSGITNSIASLSKSVFTLEERVLSLENNSGGSGSIGDSVTLSSITGKNDLLTISTSNMVFPNATTFRTLTTGQPALVMMNLNGTNAVQLFGVQALQFVTTTNGSTWTRKNFNVSKAISLGLLT